MLIGKILFEDGAYDSKDVLDVFCRQWNHVIIKVRKNAKVKKTNHFIRNLLVIS
jgi:hypothetical protein